MKTRALGTSISYLPAHDSVLAPVFVGSLTSVGEISPDSEELDATTLDSVGGYREFLQGFKDSGEVVLNGYLDDEAEGQDKMRELYGTGALGYFAVRFPDATTVAFKAYVKSHTSGSADVDGIVNFACALRVSGLVQVMQPKAAEPKAIADGGTAALDATTTALTGVPSYQWYSNNSDNYDTPTIISGATGATYTTPALSAGVYYYFCKVTVAGYAPVNTGIFKVTAA